MKTAAFQDKLRIYRRGTDAPHAGWQADENRDLQTRRIRKISGAFEAYLLSSDKGLIQVDAENCALRGYAFVYQFCRGTGGSEGEWFPNINERDDGIDTVNWICEQPWCEAVGYWGASYTALTGWAFADAAKGKVSSMFLVHYGTDRFASAYHKGLFHHDILTSWSMQNAGRPVDADYISSCGTCRILR